MPETMKFDLVSPERMLASVQANEVQIPGADGDLTAMAGHAPLITSLRPGIVTAQTAQGEVKYAVTGGFAEISAEAVTVMAERALPRAELTNDVMRDWVAEARKAHADAHHSVADDAAKLLADMVAMGGHIGLDTGE